MYRSSHVSGREVPRPDEALLIIHRAYKRSKILALSGLFLIIARANHSAEIPTPRTQCRKIDHAFWSSEVIAPRGLFRTKAL